MTHVFADCCVWIDAAVLNGSLKEPAQRGILHLGGKLSAELVFHSSPHILGTTMNVVTKGGTNPDGTRRPPLLRSVADAGIFYDEIIATVVGTEGAFVDSAPHTSTVSDITDPEDREAVAGALAAAAATGEKVFFLTEDGDLLRRRHFYAAHGVEILSPGAFLAWYSANLPTQASDGVRTLVGELRQKYAA